MTAKNYFDESGIDALFLGEKELVLILIFMYIIKNTIINFFHSFIAI